ncbi:MAG: cell division protein FtsQ/DivIB [Bacteroidales bacterium]
MRKFASIVFYLLIPLGVFILLGFAVESNRAMPCIGFKVKPEGAFLFLDSAEIVRQVYARFDEPEGKPLRDISLRNLEDMITKMYYVERGEVYRTIDGQIVARVKQRQPIARIINAHNESFYIDSNGKLMKTSPRYTARVVVATGHIAARYSTVTHLREEKEEIGQPEQVLRDLDELVRFIRANRFWNAWIDQVFVTRGGDFELIPKNGAHVIELGGVDNMEEKFNKLMLFYRQGLTHVGWNNYKRINLKFNNQIVCSK